ncbi:NUDIX domain-containing protein [Bifidobacterium leontopitheci]|uniref:ADP-ribose pyrophosphatase n=1 Tax=Bifidobacterium leontopitheci TaxID=2650774 RepID=A0A6I1GK98_9BIFI|nr:NUDIX hydrolase [Bifidobacterium leontopitheci]KAB7790066.1 ADP-ribose pyrophosphatase [Bifidobacterium leontopitheci]
MGNETYRPFDPWRPSPVKENGRKEIFNSHYFNIDHVNLESAASGTFDRYVLHGNNGDTVGVLAVTDDGMVPLVEQYRIPTHRWTLEIPGGHPATPTERPSEVAERKLREEAGYEAKELVQFTRFIDEPSFSSQYTSLFLATSLSQVERAVIGPESPRSDVRLFTPEEAVRLIINGTIVDAKTIIAILRLNNGLLKSIKG